MAEKEVPAEQFLQLCEGTRFFVIGSGEAIYAFEHWHNAVCTRGATALPPQ